MSSSRFFVLMLVLASLAFCLPYPSHRELSWNDTQGVFDYVVVGCGISGLVVATRLSEDPNVSVLCIEAGSLDKREAMVAIPAFIGEQPADFYAYNLLTIPQNQLDNHTRILPMGRGVGGGSLVNGMIWNRGNQEDFDLWASLGNQGWDWNSLLPYFMKSESYTPRAYANLTRQPVTFVPAVHGSSGPVQVSYPVFYWPQTDNWFGALNALDIPSCVDPNEGTSAGSYFLPSSIDPASQTRSDARRAYHDKAANRSNYHVLTDAQVVRILFRRGAIPRAIGVRTLDGRRFVARREVILAAGAIHTPKVLEHSGVGDGQLLSALNISVVADLPGVGSNLQDHALLRVKYPYQNTAFPNPQGLLTNSTFNSSSAHEYLTSRTGPWTAKPSTAIAFPSLSQITNTTYALGLILSATQDSLGYYPLSHTSGHDSTSIPVVKAGYQAQFPLLLQNLMSASTPAYEVLNDNSGGLDIALMRPLSRGTTHIISPDETVDPAVDPNWLSHPLDFEIMVAAMRFNQRILDTDAIRALEPSYTQVSPNATRPELEAFIRQGINTEYHYSGTCAMMPRGLGGVVDADLSVYGTAGLRIVDTSVYPVVPGAHLQSVAYAVAERAADVIRGRTGMAGRSSAEAVPVRR
ncbi:hypothetical protein PV08_09335 [Exophiala spinifera]|uniref:Glucose-methanol-choline oxidoreductase N-terminal domain-containing protein n=1 Tax=Exophiala spinifera TaxID=91928 RepID=A0A0D1YAX9_9EURO|nr:uncharacterized protein PV08_09335 [Exophiala spinifera]KIW12061.1 hypothetical protein PV08_09335 [Exophiala spinifera]